MVARSTQRVTWVLFPLVLAVFFITAFPSSAQENAPATGLTERFPPGSLLVFRIEDIDRSLNWLGASPFAQMIKDPEVKPLYEQISGMLNTFNNMAKERVGVDFLTMLEQVKGEAAVGLTKFQITSRGPSAGVMLALDCRDGAEAFKKDVQALLKLVPEGLFEKTDREIKGVPIESFVPVKKPNRRRDPLQIIGPIHIAWVGSVFLLSNDKSGFDKFILASLKDEQVATLGQTENWRDTMEKLGGMGDFTFFLNIHAISELLEAAMPMMPGAVGPIIAALGLDEFPALGSSVFLKQDAITSKSILRFTGDGKSGLGSLMTFKKADLSIPAWVPEDAMNVAIFNYDFEKAFSGVLGLVQEAGEEPYEEFQEGLDEFHKEFGLSLQDDLIGALAGPVILVSYAPIGGGDADLTNSPNLLFNPMRGQGTTLFGIRIRNRKPIEQFFEFFEGLGAEVTEYMGATIFRSPSMGEDQPVAEAAITDNYLLFGIGTTSVVRQTLQRMGGRESGFASAKGVRDATAPLPREGIGLAVANYGKTMTAQLNMLKMFMKLSKQAETLAKFPVPSSDIFAKYLGYSAGVFTFEPGTGLIADSVWMFKRQ